MNVVMIKSRESSRMKQEKALEMQRLRFTKQYKKLQRAVMDESSLHYATKMKLEKAEIERLDAEFALKKERRKHERMQKEMYMEIASLKHELANARKLG